MHSEAQLVGSEAGLCPNSWAASSQDSALRGSKDTHPLKVQTDQHPEVCTWTFCVEGRERGKKPKTSLSPTLLPKKPKTQQLQRPAQLTQPTNDSSWKELPRVYKAVISR